MTELHKVFDDLAAEITPANPPVEPTMLQGRRIRNGRVAAVIGGTAATVVVAVGAALGFSALAHIGDTLPVRAGIALAEPTPLIRPVLLEEGRDSTAVYGNAHLVNAATLRLFRKLTCEPGANETTVNDRWKTSLGYTAAQWNAPGDEAVSCDPRGIKYVLGPAVVLRTQVTTSAPAYLANERIWVVNLTMNHTATAALGRLTTRLYNSYNSGATAGNEDDAALGSIALVFNGDVYEPLGTAEPITDGELSLAGPYGPYSLTKAEAEALAARL